MAKKKLACDLPTALMLTTQKLLNESDVSLAKISVDTEIPFHWLSNFHRDIGNPGVNRIETLYAYLSGKQLELL